MSLTDFVPTLPTLLTSNLLFEVPVLTIREDLLQLADGTEHSHYTLHIGAAAVMILVTYPGGGLIINREYRHSTGQILWSCPGGVLDQGEDPIEGARRELQEETGFVAENLHLIGRSYPAPGICSQMTYFIAGERATCAGPPQRDSEEFIETHQISMAQLQDKIAAGEPVDGNLCAALYWNSRI
jgi:ADP-ribose pyrophosphatase